MYVFACACVSTQLHPVESLQPPASSFGNAAHSGQHLTESTCPYLEETPGRGWQFSQHPNTLPASSGRRRMVGGGLASLAQHHREDGTTSSLGPVSMGREQRAVCSGGLVVEVEAAVWLELGLSPRRVEEVVDELLHHRWVCLGIVGVWQAQHSTIEEMGPPHRLDV